MNAPIFRLFVVVCVLFAVLIGFTSRWTVFEATALRDNTNNKRAVIQELKIRRGTIKATNGTTLARSVPAQGDTYSRTYPTDGLFGHVTGYSSSQFGQTGLEKQYSDELSGKTDDISTVLRQFEGRRTEGDDVVTNLDAKAQKVAQDALGGRKGAVVAIEPATGKVRVMAANPQLNPNTIIDDPKALGALNKDPDASLIFRATQSAYPPGSTFKVVTAAAAIDSGKANPDSTYNGKSPQTFSGVPLNNFANEQFGDISLTTALTNSVNTVYAQVGLKVGKATMKEYMDKFGFDSKPDIDLPDEMLLRSGERRGGEILSPTSKFVDLGRMAIGQDKLLVTPLQMAEVAATIANDGVRMKPRIADRIVDKDGRTKKRFGAEEAGRAISAETARQLTAMMKNVVREGTGTAAALSGVEVAGKTGTAELNIAQRINQPWFIGFTSNMAVAVTLERVQGGTGGVDAAPIAKAVLESLGTTK